jgi:peptide/nickel transport system substrate-binding protein
MNVSGPAASPEFLAALDKVRKTPLDDPNYKKVLHDAVSIGVQQSSTDYLYSTPWVIVSNPKLSKLNLLPSQFRWEGVTEQK